MLDAKLVLAFTLGALGGAASERFGSTDPAVVASSPSPAQSKTPPAGDACDACIAAANSGNFAGAAKAASSCQDAAKKKQCTTTVKKSAPGAAQAAAFNGECGKAKAIAAAATSMGAGSSSLKSAIKTCP